jgi:hypothetical protein
VQRAPGLPCALFSWGEREFAKLGQMMSRDRGVVSAHSVIVRLDRTIQYSEALTMESRTRGVLDARLRGHDSFWLLHDKFKPPLPLQFLQRII